MMMKTDSDLSVTCNLAVTLGELNSGHYGIAKVLQRVQYVILVACACNTKDIASLSVSSSFIVFFFIYQVMGGYSKIIYVIFM